MDVLSINHDMMAIEDIDQVKNVLTAFKPEIIINTAAYHNVEKCEIEPEKAFLINGIGSKNLAIVANDLGSYLIHFSTDYVFDGNKTTPYFEENLPNPLNVYGNTKLSGEHFIIANNDNYAILRVSGLYGINPCRAKNGNNFVKTMIKLGTEREEVKVVNDEFLTPTSTLDLANNLKSIVKEKPVGLFHMTAQGSCSWYEFAKVIFEQRNLPAKLTKVDSNYFPSKIKRPKYSVLENKALNNLGLDNMKHWEECLKTYLEQLY
jgi:dTDP-4-dehydrorhamnose reductase